MWKLTQFLLFWCSLQNVLFWPTSYYGLHWMVAAIPLFILLVNSNHWFDRTYDLKSVILITILYCLYIIIFSGPIPAVAHILAYSIAICICFLKNKYKRLLLAFFTKWFGIIIAISLIPYIIWLGSSYPPISILKAPFGYYNMLNYFFFLIPDYFLPIPRFSGPFIEPGHISTVCAFIIISNRYNFKRNKLLWFILVGILFSLSLAGYLLVGVGYLFHIGISFKKIIATSIIAISSFLFITQFWNNGDNPINNRIFERLEYDDEKGISGNNRNQLSTILIFEEMIKNKSIHKGIGIPKASKMTEDGIIGGAGIIMFMITHGTIGCLLILILYWKIANSSVNKRFAYSYFILFLLCFLQRSYPSWFAIMIPYICIMRFRKTSLYPHRYGYNLQKKFIKS